ncbi:DUF6750 family protein, partial [Enterobacter hormaechei]
KRVFITGFNLFVFFWFIVGVFALWLKKKRGKYISGGLILWSLFVGACLVGLTEWISSVG